MTTTIIERIRTYVRRTKGVKAAVIHADWESMDEDTRFRMMLAPTPEMVEPLLPHYRFAAGVTTDDLDDVYRVTNSIEDHWHFNDEVIDSGESMRSTSIGDVIVTAKGAHVVATFGFASL